MYFHLVTRDGMPPEMDVVMLPPSEDAQSVSHLSSSVSAHAKVMQALQ
jgi:hypothetical protein